jgi:hypothetical protein
MQTGGLGLGLWSRPTGGPQGPDAGSTTQRITEAGVTGRSLLEREGTKGAAVLS